MTYDEAMKTAKDGKAVRHVKMGRGFVVRWADGEPRIFRGDSVTPYKLNSEDRAEKTWEIVE